MQQVIFQQQSRIAILITEVFRTRILLFFYLLSQSVILVVLQVLLSQVLFIAAIFQKHSWLLASTLEEEEKLFYLIKYLWQLGKKYLITTVAVELLHFCNTVPNLFCTWSFQDSVYEFLHQSPETSSAVSYRQRLCWNIFLSVLAIALCCVVQQQHFAYKC